MRRDGPGTPGMLWRTARWGAERRFRRARLGRERSVAFAGSMRIRVRLDDAVGREIFVHGTSEYYLAAVLERLLAPGETAVDVGANVGEHTLRAARRVGPAGTVVAVEPQPEVFRALQRSVAENGFADRVRLICAAASDREGEGLLYLPEHAGNSGLATLEADSPRAGGAALGGGAARLHVPLIRLDDVLVGLAAVSLIKVDVEGHERPALAGAERTVAAFRPAILFEADADSAAWTDPGSTTAVLQGLGYEVFGIVGHGPRWRLEALASRPPLERLRERWKGPRYPINLVALDPSDPRAEAAGS
ncbi:MAG TPA: FkbM family methyltransferase [Gaiellaceae bacterium]